jgi:hypothetical protein
VTAAIDHDEKSHVAAIKTKDEKHDTDPNVIHPKEE